MQELKLCPFSKCNGKGEIEECSYSTLYFVKCSGCNISLGGFDYEIQAIEAWNNRKGRGDNETD